MHDLLHRLLTASPQPSPLANINAWWGHHQRITANLHRPIERAVLAGFFADRPAYAFASGYHEALRQLVPGEGTRKRALCATEEGGNHPRAIAALLEPDGDGWRLSGNKQWTTLGMHADAYIVFAGEGRGAEGRNRIAAVQVPADRRGITREPMAELPFIPEISHARLAFDRVRVAPDERLQGDGYARYLKPFRTIEDCHVFAALLSWLLQVARRTGWPRESIEQLALALVSASAVATMDPSAAAGHIGLAGLLARMHELVAQCEPYWARVDDVTRSRWLRDRRLLQVAGKARTRRREVAWERLDGEGVASTPK
jgi:hypothetical protein